MNAWVVIESDKIVSQLAPKCAQTIYIFLWLAPHHICFAAESVMCCDVCNPKLSVACCTDVDAKCSDCSVDLCVHCSVNNIDLLGLLLSRTHSKLVCSARRTYYESLACRLINFAQFVSVGSAVVQTPYKQSHTRKVCVYASERWALVDVVNDATDIRERSVL